MTQKLLTLAFASAFVAASGIALAAGPNDAFSYPNAESHKQYSAYRNQDHNNPSPRYPVTATTNKQYPAYRNQDHNNASPRYATTTTQPAARAAATRTFRYPVHAMRRPAVNGSHG
jgi:hypothetical protein